MVVKAQKMDVDSPRAVTDFKEMTDEKQQFTKAQIAYLKLPIPSKSEVMAVIPPHCFERSILHGFAYIARDAAVISIFAYTASLCLSTTMPSIFDPVSFASWAIGWSIYAFWQVCIFCVFKTASYALAYNCLLVAVSGCCNDRALGYCA